MTSVPYAFAWTMWRQHRAGLRFLGICLVALAALTALLTRILLLPRVPSVWLEFVAPGILAVLVVLLSVPFTLAYVILTYGTEGTDVLSRESCFPPAQFRLPVRTAWLAAWPIAVGAVVMVLLWLGAAWFLLRPWVIAIAMRHGVWADVPLLWPALLAVAILAWSQAVMWNSFGLPWLRVVVFMLLFVAGTALTPIAVDRLPEAALCGLLVGCIVMGWTVAYRGVHRARRGETPDWRFLLAPVHSLLRRLSWPRTAFATASRAQFWMEWRLSGYSLPIMMVLVAPFMVWPLIFVRQMDTPARNDFSLKDFSSGYLLLSTLALPIFFAGVFGAAGGGGYSPGMKSRKAGLGSFVAGLPMTTTDMVAAMLKSAVVSTLVTWSWMIVVLVFAVGVVLAFRTGAVPDWWSRYFADIPPAKRVIGILGVLILAIVWTWKRQIDRLYFTLTGRVGATTVLALSAVAKWFLLALLAYVRAGHWPSRVFLDDGIPWVLGGVMVARLVAAIWALREVVRRGFVRRRTAALGVVGWMLVAAVLIGVLVWTVPAVLVPTRYVVFAVLFALPMVRLPASRC